MLPGVGRLPAQGQLPANLMHFARILRGAGLAVGPQQIADALAALDWVGVERREDVHAALSAVFVDRHAQQALFDQAFALYWRNPRLLERLLHLLSPKVRAPGALRRPALRERLAQLMFPNVPAAPAAAAAPPAVELDMTLTVSAREALQHKDFEDMTLAEQDAVRTMIRELRLPLPELPTRRFRPAATGERIDPRRTLRAMIRSGGDGLPLARRERAWRHPPLVVLCDISGSMERYTRMLLYFLHAICNGRERVQVFLFGTRLTPVTRALRSRDVDAALAALTDAVDDWAGGTRIASCLALFNRDWSRRVLAQNAVVLLISDGLDSEAGAALGHEMARLRRSCRRLLWLNPLLRYAGFEAKPAGIRAMLPEVDAFLPVHNLDSLRQLAGALRMLGVQRPCSTGGSRTSFIQP